MSEYQLELKQIVDYPRCRIYRQFIGLLMKDKSIRVGGTSGLYHFTVLSCFANFRTSYKRIDGISYTIYPGEWLCRVSELTEWFRTRFQHQALAILRELQDRHLITYTLLGRGQAGEIQNQRMVQIQQSFRVQRPVPEGYWLLLSADLGCQ